MAEKKEQEKLIVVKNFDRGDKDKDGKPVVYQKGQVFEGKGSEELLKQGFLVTESDFKASAFELKSKDERIAELKKENEELKARIAEFEAQAKLRG